MLSPVHTSESRQSGLKSASLPIPELGAECQPLPVQSHTQRPQQAGEDPFLTALAGACPVLGSNWPGPDPSWTLHGPESAARFPEQLPWGCGSDWDSGRERGPLTITLTPVWGTPPDSPQHPLCARLGGGMAGERGSQHHCCHLWAEAMGLLPASVSHRSLCPGSVWSPGPSAPPPAAGIASAQSWRDPGAGGVCIRVGAIAGPSQPTSPEEAHLSWSGKQSGERKMFQVLAQPGQRCRGGTCQHAWGAGRQDLGLHDPPPPVATTVELSIGSIHGSRGLTCWRLQPVLPSLGLGSERKWCGGKPVPASSFRLPDQLAGPAATSGPTLPNVLGGDPFPKSFLSLGLGTQKALKWSSARRGPGPRGLLVLAPGGC
ncbi:uncharacterized protein LOC111169396 [Delphinapterus leucas]|uniref:Uncharacterized protein LOC111169396 n=1 Tax=Delphinapterus leucas TaxID=9749 RepID=A0A2Y9MC31_DELLE|nr:uncharacterized protein LOC111169396 [Delphinapterus leucas]